MEELKGLDLKTARAYHIKLALARFWEIADPAVALAYLKRWYFWATHSRLSAVIRAARTIKHYWAGVHITNLRTIVYLVAGKLSFIYPY